MKITVIISAYKNCRALQHCLHAYGQQTRLPDQIIVAEDDQGSDIAELLRQTVIAGVDVVHISQPNNGFGKCRIFNQAIKRSSGDLLIFTDADCIPRNDFVAMHETKSRPGSFMSGGSHINIPQAFHQSHDVNELISNQRLFDYAYLAQIPGFKKSRWRLTRNRFIASLLDWLTQRNALSGASASAFRQDVLAVQGFDESMGYGGEDINLGVRLNNIGIRGRRLRHSFCYVHLDHPRGYVHTQVVAQNKLHNKKIRQEKTVWPQTSALQSVSPEN